jgi:hypothetical protein
MTDFLIQQGEILCSNIDPIKYYRSISLDIQENTESMILMTLQEIPRIAILVVSNSKTFFEFSFDPNASIDLRLPEKHWGKFDIVDQRSRDNILILNFKEAHLNSIRNIELISREDLSENDNHNIFIEAAKFFMK